jgi:alpha-glucosidase (family GH31 glycosyl hydrolase)
LQYGVFQPIFRPHAHEAVAEPVYKDIVTKAKAKKLVELRYQMLPYITLLLLRTTKRNTADAPLVL